MEGQTADVTGQATGSQVADAAAVAAQADATQKLGWRSELPDALKENEAFKPYATKNDLWNGHIDLLGKVKDYEGKLTNAILKPAADAPEEVKTAYRQSLLKEIGVPEKPEDYNLTKPADWPADVPYDEALLTGFREQAFKLGLPKEAVEGLNGWYHSMLKGAIEAKQNADREATEKANKEIRTEWGADFDKNAALCAKVAEALKGKYQHDWLVAQDDPMIMRLLLELAPKYVNDSAAQGGSGGQLSDEAAIRAFYEKPTNNSPPGG